MRDINNLNREHDDKLKECCKCPSGKEIIYCGCECHKVCSHKHKKYDGYIPNTGRLICQDCGEQLN